MGSTRCVVVTVSVTVLTEVETVVLVLVLVLVLVDGGWVVVVVVVTGSVVVVVVGSSEAGVVAVGDWVTVCVTPGSGATDADVSAVVDVVDEVVVVVAGLEPLPPVNFTIAKTSSARMAAVSTPRPTRAAGFRYQGVGSGDG